MIKAKEEAPQDDLNLTVGVWPNPRGGNRLIMIQAEGRGATASLSLTPDNALDLGKYLVHLAKKELRIL
ncbi:hypothetical protein GP475_08905 [Corynebacterium poyangense]|uniref:Uncharacterized protein n=1 Tax=Corynebacterium poyangense TaxID=2684405 RepID=A0A7H0SQC0_9CORY|nr:hypothetical protein [Corynebacterium poyangense]QNQ90745.1 hypothetical protein GP475_08905 [Corynebacterium poyangense]